jgi:Domain of unknown function (DUF3943)
MPGKYCTLVLYVARCYGLALLLLLYISGDVRVARADGTDATLHLEPMPSRASGAVEQKREKHVHLPFMDKKTYHFDVLSRPALTDQRHLHAHECAETACQGNTQAVVDHALGLHDARQRHELSVLGPQDAPSSTSERFAELLEKSAYVSTVDVGIILVMRQLPTSFTKWTADSSTEKIPLRQWQKHVTPPPVFDKDLPTVNVSHAYSGSGYYTLCRNTPGFSNQETRHMLECLAYAAVMSTFWEYGVEAFMEVPSIQDLIVTPVGGAVLGEIFHRLQRQIVANGGELLGSKLLGRVVIVLLNPLEEVVQVLRVVAGPVVDQYDLRLQVTYGNLTPDLRPPAFDPTHTETTLMLQVSGRWPVKRVARRK